MEKITLTTPISTTDLINYTVKRLDLNWSDAILHVDVLSNIGKQFSHEYRGIDATNKMIALNKANLSVKSLHRRILEQLITDGILAGTVEGTPD